MGELLIRKEHPAFLDMPGVNPRTEAVFSGDTFISVVESSESSGVTPAGKTWKSFRDERVTTYTWKNGPMRVYEKTRTAAPVRGGRTKMGPLRDHTAHYLNLLHARGKASEGILSEAGVSVSLHEKMMAQYPMREYVKFAPTVTPLLTSENHVELSRKVLGKRYQKSVARALVGVSDEPLIAEMALKGVILFQGIIPTDWIPRLIAASPEWRNQDFYLNRTELREYRRILRTASETQLRRITTRDVDTLPRMLREVWRDDGDEVTPLNLKERTFTTLSNLHDQVTAERNAQRYVERINWRGATPDPREPLIIEYKDTAKDFAKEYDGFTVVAPTSREDLLDWSSFMSNCISSYAYQAAQQQTLLYSVEVEGKMVANIELDPRAGSIKQLLGKFNQSVKPEIGDKIKAAIIESWPEAVVNGGWQ